MSLIEEKLAKSLSAQSVELLPFLPYLLQDLLTLGACPDIFEKVLTKVDISVDTSILDLACGKGNVSIHLAKKYGCRILGIDLMPEFIETAMLKAKRQGVSDICTFQVGDVNTAFNANKGYDIVMMTDVSTIMDCSIETMEKLKSTIKEKGNIVVDDAYVQNDSKEFMTRSQWLVVFDKSGLQVMDEIRDCEFDSDSTNESDLRHIKQRAKELIQKHPELEGIFDGYVKAQEKEIDLLENELHCATWLLKAI